VWGSLRYFHTTCKCYSGYDSICPVGHDIEECRREVDLSIQRLFYWGAYADKYGGQVQVRSCVHDLTISSPPSHPPVPFSLPSSSQETTLYGCTVRINEPVGVIGIACPDESPLLAFVSLFAPAVIKGNIIVVLPVKSNH